MKKLLSILSVLSVLSISSPARAASFPDIQSPSLRSQVEYLSQQGIMSGYPDGTFRVDRVINRAEALKIIFESRGIELEDDTNSGFPDVDRSQWFAKYVTTAKQLGLINGYADGSYRPADPVQTVEFIKIATLAQRYYQEVNDFTDIRSQYADIDDNQWYLPYVAFAHQKGFLANSIRLRPGQGLSRGDAATIIYKIAKFNEGQPEQGPVRSSTSDKGYPENTNMADMTPEERAYYIADHEFVFDPTKDRAPDPKLGPDQLIVTFDINLTQISHKLHGYDLTINEVVGVKAYERTAETTSIRFPDECVIKVFLKDDPSIDLVYQRLINPDGFMRAYEQARLLPLSQFGVDAYEVRIDWDDGPSSTYLVKVPAGVIELNTDYRRPECVQKTLDQILPNISIR